jgi:hypothetical protein
MIRCAVYLYFAGGTRLLLGDGMVRALRYKLTKGSRRPSYSSSSFGIFGLLALVS